MWIAAVSIRRPVLAAMIIGGLVALGWISLGRIGVDLFPRVEFPFVGITTQLEGASPETVEMQVSDILEGKVNTIAGIESLRSASVEGVSQVFVEFGLAENVDVKAQDVRDKVNTALTDLPTDVKPSVVEKVDTAGDPILSVMVAGDLSRRDITHFADKVVKERLQRLSGVGDVSLVGGLERQIRIWLDAGRLRALGVTSDDVVRAIRAEHAEVPGGRIEVDGQREELSVKTMGEVRKVEDFGNIVVAFRQGAPTFVRDVARVEDGAEDERTYAELNGKPGVSLEVRKQSGKNTVEVAHAVKRELALIEKDAPVGLKLIVARDSSRFIEGSARDVSHEMVIGILLVTGITFLFLVSVRATIIVALAMPTSIVATFFAFYVADFTFNMSTLMALSVSIGLLVDDAIVVLESIHRHLEEGHSPMEAALLGTEKVGFAVLAATLSVVAVFAPIAFMSGVVGKFFFEYGLAVVFSVSVSLLVSVTLTPMLCSRFLRIDPMNHPIGKSLNEFHAKLDQSYTRWLNWSMERRGKVLLAAFITVVLGILIAGRIPFAFQSPADRSEFIGRVSLVNGTGIGEAKEIARRLSETLQKLPHAENVFITIGAGTARKVNEISFYVGLSHKSERDLDQFAIMAEARKAVTAATPEAVATAASEIQMVGGSSGAFASYDLDYTLRGAEFEVLTAEAARIMAKMAETGVFADMRTSFEPGRPEVQIEIDRQRAADLGISVRTLASTLRTLVGGVTAGSFEDGGSRYDVRVQLDPAQRTDIQRLGQIQVRAANNQTVDLSNVANFKVASGPAQIDRMNRSRKISIYANMARGKALGEGAAAIDKIVASEALPPGYIGSHEGQIKRMKESGQAVGAAFGLALLTLYMILASQFNSFSQPVVVMLTAPLSFAGAFFLLWATGTSMSLFAQIGMIALMGLVMKNGILLVDLANQLQAEGTSAHEAIIKAAPERMRPVLMTQIATIFGMIPVALTQSDGGEFRAPLGVLVIGGLISSTFLTLFVVPAAYSLLAQGLAAGRRRFGGVITKLRPAE